MVERVPMTVVGYQRLKEELKHLKEVERPQNILDIETARAHGDLSENAEYHAAKEKQGLIDMKMRDVEAKLSRAEVIDPSTLSGDRVVFGATVHLEEIESEEEVVYQIVGMDEGNPAEGKISISSPLARALISKRIGDEVTFATPGGSRSYEIVDVEFI